MLVEDACMCISRISFLLFNTVRRKEGRRVVHLFISLSALSFLLFFCDVGLHFLQAVVEFGSQMLLFRQTVSLRILVSSVDRQKKGVGRWPSRGSLAIFRVLRTRLSVFSLSTGDL